MHTSVSNEIQNHCETHVSNGGCLNCSHIFSEIPYKNEGNMSDESNIDRKSDAIFLVIHYSLMKFLINLSKIF